MNWRAERVELPLSVPFTIARRAWTSPTASAASNSAGRTASTVSAVSP